jgi:hypothetical protein
MPDEEICSRCDWVELRPNGLRMILSLVPAAAPPTDCKVASSPESFRCGSRPRGGDEVRHRCTRPEGDQSRSGAAQGSQAKPPLLRRPTTWLVAASVRWTSWQVSKASAIVCKQSAAARPSGAGDHRDNRGWNAAGGPVRMRLASPAPVSLHLVFVTRQSGAVMSAQDRNVTGRAK